MRFRLIAAVICLAVRSTLSAPTSASGEKLVSSVRVLPLPEGASTSSLDLISPRIVDKGKRKLIDRESQLEAYLARKEPRRTQPGIRIREPRGETMSTLQRDDGSRETLSASYTSRARKGRSPPGANAEGVNRVGRGYRPLAKVVQWDNRLKKGGTRAKVQKSRREAFERVWEQQGLNLDMSPTKLADNVVAMRKEEGIHSKSSCSIAARLVHAKNDPTYENRYLARMARVLPCVSTETTAIANDDALSKLPEKQQLSMALERAFKMVAKSDKRRQRRAALGAEAPLAYKKSYVIKIEKLGKLVKEHLARKKLDFKTMPLFQLIQETRDLAPQSGLEARDFTRTLYRFLQYERGDTEEALAAVTRARTKP